MALPHPFHKILIIRLLEFGIHVCDNVPHNLYHLRKSLSIVDKACSESHLKKTRIQIIPHEWREKNYQSLERKHILEEINACVH